MLNPIARTHLTRPRGFTLVELMVVVAIVGVLMGAAVMSLQPSSYSNTPRGFADKIGAQLDVIRTRATATGRWQRLRVGANLVEHLEATTVGMATPTAWNLVQELPVPNSVAMQGVGSTTKLTPDGSSAPTNTLGTGIDFAPDGTGEAATIYLQGDNKQRRYRVAVFRSTGMAYVFEGW